MKNVLFSTVIFVVSFVATAQDTWVIDSQKEWQAESQQQNNLEFKNGFASPMAKESIYTSKLKTFDKKRSATSLTFKQSPIWQNWNPVSNVGPANLQDAPVMLSIGPGNYWILGRYGSKKAKKKKGQKTSKAKAFEAKSAKLKGFDIPLMTTQYTNQYNAPGGMGKTMGGYHAWQSKDMINWVHHGPVTEKFSRWVTTAEYVDGKFYIYYDYPNDQDPHLYIDDNLFDGKPGKNMGMAFKDPSDGSDCAFIRDAEGKFHVIYEDWSPIDANKRSWDSPLAGHAVSDDGIKGFEILPPAVDHRTTPTGKFAEYKHPHWLQHPDFKSNIAKYEIHTPEQKAYGDWAAINIGGQYYLFGDYDPSHGHNMSTGWFTSDSLDKKFTWCDNIGNGHPDPDVGFANDQFYLVTQQKTDYVSPGPWTGKVEARAGVDTDKDGSIDQWTKWQGVQESYDHKPGFAKHVVTTPASMDLSNLPEGYGFQFEFKLTDTTENKSKPIMDKVILDFK
ncbi:MAG: hypothetical protein NE330_20940 [Lentisphaeraceae bacterium]|nr:hypothetical protein [Lentisphaeraceae bacterium]